MSENPKTQQGYNVSKMADHGGTTEFPVLKLDILDVNAQSILLKSGSDTRTSIVDELEHDVDIDTLLDQREKLFDCAKSKLDDLLLKNGMLDKGEKVNIELAKRTAVHSHSNVAKDIVEMYEYIVGLSTIFPKGVLCKKINILIFHKKTM